MRKQRDVKIIGGEKLYKCSGCGEFLSKEKFSKNVYGYDFLSSECKKCYNLRMRKYREQNKDKLTEYKKNYKAKRMMILKSHPGQPNDKKTQLPDFARAEQMRLDNLKAAEEEKRQLEDEEIIVQAAIDKNPDAYTEILSDEDLLNAFNNRSIESKINELTRRQQKFDKQKAEKEYNIMKEKMRDLVDATLDDEQKKRFEDKLHSLHEAQQDEFVRKVSKLSTASFPVSREAIFEAQLDIQTGKIKSKDVII